MTHAIIRTVFFSTLFLSLVSCNATEQIVTPDAALGSHGVSLNQRLDPALITIDSCIAAPPAAPMTVGGVLLDALSGQAKGEMLAARIAQACPAFAPVLLDELNTAGVDYRIVPSLSSNAADFPEAKYRIEIASPFEYADYENNGTTYVAAVSVSVWDLHSGKFIGMATIRNPKILNLANYTAIGITGSRCRVGYAATLLGCKGFVLSYNSPGMFTHVLAGNLPPQ